ncbi:MAG TPA: DUF4956 domain-containing protein [Methylomirabilota bacterium]|nr:DUF4956 domain-containing protein [Methylomirabilota bacterium]
MTNTFPEFLQASGPDHAVAPAHVFLRLLTALVLGVVVAWVYRRARKGVSPGGSFPTTLVLLCVLIAMVTQVIGNNVARAFSLVGALSIVRFRTVVRDTQDTAYVIFAVVVGMAVGSQNLWVALGGIVVVALAAAVLRFQARGFVSEEPWYLLTARVSVGQDLDALLKPVFDTHLAERELQSISTAKGGVAVDATYQVRFKQGLSIDSLLKNINRLEGVHNVEIERRGIDDD